MLFSLPQSDASTDQLAGLARILQQFVADNLDAPPATTGKPVRLDALVSCLQRADVAAMQGLTASLLRAIKILARRPDTRATCTARNVATLLSHCSTTRHPDDAVEAVNALVNLAHEPVNVRHLLAAKGEQVLLRLLNECGHAATLHMVAAAAVQAVSFQADGRAALLDVGAVPTLLRALAAADGVPILEQRLAGGLQNLLSEHKGVALIRQHQGLPTLVRLLSTRHEGCLEAAVGCLHNMTRDPNCCEDLLHTPAAVAGLVALLASNSAQAAALAAGVLVNILQRCRNASVRAQVAQAMAGLIAGGAVCTALFGEAGC